jgi:hypothetical protein
MRFIDSELRRLQGVGGSFIRAHTHVHISFQCLLHFLHRIKSDRIQLPLQSSLHCIVMDLAENPATLFITFAFGRIALIGNIRDLILRQLFGKEKSLAKLIHFEQSLLHVLMIVQTKQVKISFNKRFDRRN